MTYIWYTCVYVYIYVIYTFCIHQERSFIYLHHLCAWYMYIYTIYDLVYCIRLYQWNTKPNNEIWFVCVSAGKPSDFAQVWWCCWSPGNAPTRTQLEDRQSFLDCFDWFNYAVQTHKTGSDILDVSLKRIWLISSQSTQHQHHHIRTRKYKKNHIRTLRKRKDCSSSQVT